MLTVFPHNFMVSLLNEDLGENLYTVERHIVGLRIRLGF